MAAEDDPLEEFSAHANDEDTAEPEEYEPSHPFHPGDSAGFLVGLSVLDSHGANSLKVSGSDARSSLFHGTRSRNKSCSRG